MRCQAQRKLPARGMSGYAYSCQIEFCVAAVLLQGLVGAADVFQAGRPSSARIAYTAILHVPRSNAGAFQRVTEMTRMDQVIPRTPEAAVYEEDHRMRPISLGQPDVYELIQIHAIAEPQVRFG